MNSPHSWCGAIIYWLFVFSVSVIFTAILIAQFYKSYDEFSAKAYVNVIVCKTMIVQQMDEMLNCFMCACKCYVSW